MLPGGADDGNVKMIGIAGRGRGGGAASSMLRLRRGVRVNRGVSASW
jgi:hypothetical protein